MAAYESARGVLVHIGVSDIEHREAFKKSNKLVFVRYGGHEVRGGRTRRDGDPKASIEALKAAGINAHYFVSPKTGHEWLSWRRSLREFAQLLFRDGIEGQWLAPFDTVIGVQTYHFND